MGKRILGLDIGIASVGWAVVEYDKEDMSENQIIKSGVRIFTQAEHPKDGSSLAMPRRLARGARRTLKRKRQRMKGIKRLFLDGLNLSHKDLFVGESDETIYSKQGRLDVWQLRYEAVRRALNAEQLARANRKKGKKENNETV